MRFLLTALCLVGVASTPAAAAAKTETWTSEPRVWAVDPALPNSQDPQYWFDAADGSLARSRALDVIESTMGRCTGSDPETKKPVSQPCGFKPPTFPGVGDYVVIHVVKWKKPAAGSTALEIDTQRWYVVTNDATMDDDSFAGTRIMGAKKIYFLYIHLNRPPGVSYTPTYALTAAKKTSAFFNHLIALGQLFGNGAPAGGAANAKEIAVWNMHRFDIDYLPSDVTIRGRIDQASAASVAIEPKTFDNEGKYRVDFTVGVPIRKFTDLQYANANGQLAPLKVDKSAIFGLFDYYFQPVDIKTPLNSWIPHFVGGVAIQDQPWKKVLVGAGIGPLVAHVYLGVLLNTYDVPDPGGKCGEAAPATATATKSKTCAEFAFGLNMSVGSVIEALKKKPDAKAADAQAADAKPSDSKTK
jgi:hypothetical protein